MSIYDPMEILWERAKAKKEDKDLIYKCTWCGSDINLNDERSPNTFQSDKSFKEFIISGLCQKCQGETFDFEKCDGVLDMHDNTVKLKIKCNLEMGHSGPCMSLFEGKYNVATVVWSKITNIIEDIIEDENDQS